MLRLALGVVLAVLALPPPAGAEIALRDDVAATAVALAGPDALVLRDQRGGGARLLAVPRAGGPARTLLTVPSARPTWPNEEGLSASDQRVALLVEVRDEWRVYSGPPAGPLQVVRRLPYRGVRTWIPYLVDVDGDRVLLLEIQDEGEGAVRARILDPALGLVPIAWAKESFAPVAIAGPYAAVAASRPRRVAVVDLATGAERAAVRVPRFGPGLGVDLAADGRLVVATGAGLATARPGEAPQAVAGTKGLTSPRFAGGAIVAFEEGRPVVLDGARRVVGPPSRVPTDLAADASGVAWLSNGCVRHEAFAGAPAADDPCPSTEIGLYLIASSPLRGRHVRVPVRCVTAATATCRGTVLGKVGRKVVARGRFAVPVGTERRVRVRVTRAAARRFRRERFGSLIIGARVPDGRIGAGAGGSSELSIEVRR
jgi:hypothetical protein